MNLTGKLVIDFSNPNAIAVRGFPNNIHQAKAIMDAASKAVIMYFIEAAKEDRLSEDGNVSEVLIQTPGQTGLVLSGPGSGKTN